MKRGDYLISILRSPKTVFTLKDIALLWQEAETNAFRVRLNYYVQKGELYRIRKGIYAKSNTYNHLELATKVFTPSYVSFETVLAKEGVIFQYYTAITVASYLTRTITMDQKTYTYKKLKQAMLLNPMGIEQTDETSVASRERAFLDTLYLSTDYQFDNIRSLDWDKVHTMLPLYQNKRMREKIMQLSPAAKTDTLSL